MYRFGNATSEILDNNHCWLCFPVYGGSQMPGGPENVKRGGSLRHYDNLEENR